MFFIPCSSFPGSFLSLSLFCSPFVGDYVVQRGNSRNSPCLFLIFKCTVMMLKAEGILILEVWRRGTGLWGGLSSVNVCEITGEGCRPLRSTPGWQEFQTPCIGFLPTRLVSSGDLNKILITNDYASLPPVWKGQLDAIHVSTKNYRRDR